MAGARRKTEQSLFRLRQARNSMFTHRFVRAGNGHTARLSRPCPASLRSEPFVRRLNRDNDMPGGVAIGNNAAYAAVKVSCSRPVAASAAISGVGAGHDLLANFPDSISEGCLKPPLCLVGVGSGPTHKHAR